MLHISTPSQISINKPGTYSSMLAIYYSDIPQNITLYVKHPEKGIEDFQWLANVTLFTTDINYFYNFTYNPSDDQYGQYDITFKAVDSIGLEYQTNQRYVIYPPHIVSSHDLLRTSAVGFAGGENVKLNFTLNQVSPGTQYKVKYTFVHQTASDDGDLRSRRLLSSYGSDITLSQMTEHFDFILESFDPSTISNEFSNLDGIFTANDNWSSETFGIDFHATENAFESVTIYLIAEPTIENLKKYMVISLLQHNLHQ